jgi:hypothetical protein
MRRLQSTEPSSCNCRIENGRIAFCALHKNAPGLLAACQYVRELLPNCVPDEDKDAEEIRKVLLPYLDKIIEDAQKTG